MADHVGKAQVRLRRREVAGVVQQREPSDILLLASMLRVDGLS
jgi:hypothetical protein